MLLIRGADKEKTNFSNQTCSQVAILCGHHSISATISAFTADKIGKRTSHEMKEECLIVRWGQVMGEAGGRKGEG